jgi:hypothetical protein
MNRLEILQSEYHPNPSGEPFVVAIVEDVDSDDTKLVIMFEDVLWSSEDAGFEY